MARARRSLEAAGISGLEISIGDTPGCTLAEDLGNVDEIRPGNFVFFDVQQLQMGVCTAQKIAVAVACPVVAKYPERQEVVLYGGAVHLSKDTATVAGQVTYGLVAVETPEGWSDPLPGAYVARLSQEHGVVHWPSDYNDRIHVGDLLYVLPAHSCLAVSALRQYQTLDGEVLAAMV
jgi:D-serine deaminase-like pyridoxal phosphate-dependent protein